MAATLPQIQDVLPDGPIAALMKQPRRLEKTRASRGYNYPKAWYLRADGDIVSIPGDPQSSKHYREKGYRELSPMEIEDWEHNVRPVYLKNLREKARLITTINRIKLMHTDVQIDTDLSRATITQLTKLKTDLETLKGSTFNIFRIDEVDEVEAAEEAARDAEMDALLKGAIIGDGGDLEAAMKQSEQSGKVVFGTNKRPLI